MPIPRARLGWTRSPFLSQLRTAHPPRPPGLDAFLNSTLVDTYPSPAPAWAGHCPIAPILTYAHVCMVSRRDSVEWGRTHDRAGGRPSPCGKGSPRLSPPHRPTG